MILTQLASYLVMKHYVHLLSTTHMYLPYFAIMMMAFIEINLYGLMRWGAFDGREPFAKTFTKMFGTRHIKIDSHKDDIFNRRSQLICAGGAEC